jgi:hypothetical protein
MRIAIVLLLASTAHAGDVVRLSKENWRLAPKGKEADAIYGDWLLANDRVALVIADPVAGRNASDSVKDAGGAIIDFTLQDAPNDQLSGFIPGLRAYRRIEVLKGAGPTVAVRLTGPQHDGVTVETTYELSDGCTHVAVKSKWTNAGKAPATVRVADKLRCDETFLQSPAGETRLVWSYDRWFKQAYGVRGDSGAITTDGKWGGMFGPGSGTFLDYAREKTLQPGESVEVARSLFVGRHMQDVAAAAAPQATRAVVLRDPDGPVREAFVTVKKDGQAAAYAHPDDQGRLELPEGMLVIESPGRPTFETPLRGEIDLPRQTRVRFDVKDGDGLPSPCKVQFIGKKGTKDPDLGPPQRARGCTNLWYDGAAPFVVPLPAGDYQIIISRGPAVDAVFRTMSIPAGLETRVGATLVRSVRHPGWISADFHNHSTESGDNVTEIEGRILNLIGEGVEFAPCTEHNRVQSYRPWLKSMGLEKFLATSDGIELSGSPFSLNHQNAFPIELQFGRQDNGGPRPSKDPAESLRRLAEWDGKSRKLVQQNHPDFGELYRDKDGDGRADDGHDVLRWTDVIEVFKTNILAFEPTEKGKHGPVNNPIFNWLQMLNQGLRRPGVANTDAHECDHGSGRVRNYVRSTLEEQAVVEAAKRGRIVMSTGPFLEVTYAVGDTTAQIGDEIRGGRGILSVRVECANWLEVDRVQLLVNGRPSAAHNYTREKHPRMFGDGPVKFDQRLPLELSADAHLIVVAIGEKHRTSPVMGRGGTYPVAISNPVWVDADGDGFKHGGDTLDAPLPVKQR